MPLTDIAIRKAKPTDKPQRLFDGGGLYLEIAPSGGKLWRWKYRHGGKEKRLALGAYPDVSLLAARKRHAEARELLAEGVDPAEQRKAQKAAGAERAANSFEVVAREWLAGREVVEKTRRKVAGWFETDVFPWIGARAVADLTAPEFLAVIRRIESRGLGDTPARILQKCGQVMRYAVATGRAERDPTGDLRGALKQVKGGHYAAITDPAQVGELLRALEGYAGSLTVKCALRLAPLVFVRPGELRGAEWTEIDFDKAEWNIPAERMKMRLPHLVPLSTQAMAVLRELQPLTGRGRFVFPGERSRERPLSDNALNAALRRMGFDKDTMTAHGFRAMARTVLDEVMHVRPDYIEHQLAHTVKDPNGRAYNRTAHLPERRKMMQEWADYLDALRTGENVVPIHRKAG